MRLGVKVYEIRSLINTKNSFVKIKTVQQILDRNRREWKSKQDTNIMKQFGNIYLTGEILDNIDFTQIVNDSFIKTEHPYIRRKLFQRNFTNFFLFANIYVNEKNQIVMLYKPAIGGNDQKFYQFLLLISGKTECIIVSESTFEEIECIKFDISTIEEDIKKLEITCADIKDHLLQS